MRGFVLTHKAVADLVSIGSHTQQTLGLQHRNTRLAALDKAFFLLSDHPTKGRLCPEIRQGYRKHSLGENLIFYREINDTLIEITRVLWG